MENTLKTIFVYGSLRSGFHHPAYEYISKNFHLVALGKVKGLMYDMGNYPAAVSTDTDAYIIGELYRLNDDSDFSWAISQLDDYEGVDPEEGEVALYERQVTTVYYDDKEAKAWIYWYTGHIDLQPVIASGDVLQYIQQKSKL
jgi:gamma-glutamylcyclotransferase (GGCT)/AIG2-like uncharacterized protein YtfP